jgi:hypothetical protein
VNVGRVPGEEYPPLTVTLDLPAGVAEPGCLVELTQFGLGPVHRPQDFANLVGGDWLVAGWTRASEPAEHQPVQIALDGMQDAEESGGHLDLLAEVHGRGGHRGGPGRDGDVGDHAGYLARGARERDAQQLADGAVPAIARDQVTAADVSGRDTVGVLLDRRHLVPPEHRYAQIGEALFQEGFEPGLRDGDRVRVAGPLSRPA